MIAPIIIIIIIIIIINLLVRRDLACVKLHVRVWCASIRIMHRSDSHYMAGLG